MASDPNLELSTIVTEPKLRFPTDAAVRTARIFPDIVYAVNAILEVATRGGARRAAGVSKKEGVLLWILKESGKPDENGQRFLQVKDFVSFYRRWYVVSSSTAYNAVNDNLERLEKARLLVKKKIGKKRRERYYFTIKGERFVTDMLDRAAGAIRYSVEPLDHAEQRLFATKLRFIVKRSQEYFRKTK